MVNGFLTWVQKLDRFGHEVSMHYMGDRHFKTIFGSFMTITVYTLILINSITIGLAYRNNENQIEINRVISLQPESLGPMNFFDNGFDIAVLHGIPPEIGHFEFSRIWTDYEAE